MDCDALATIDSFLGVTGILVYSIQWASRGPPGKWMRYVPALAFGASARRDWRSHCNRRATELFSQHAATHNDLITCCVFVRSGCAGDVAISPQNRNLISPAPIFLFTPCDSSS